MATPLQSQERDLHAITEKVNRLSEQGDFPAVRAFVTEALRVGGLAADLERTGTLLLILADVNQALGDFEEADLRFRAAISALERAGKPAELTLAQSQINYAQLLDMRGGARDAERRRLFALDIFRRELGPDHPETLRTLGHLALGYRVRRDYARAEQLCREVIRTAQSSGRYPAYYLAFDLLTLGDILLKTGRASEAVEVFQQSLDIVEPLFGPRHPALLNSWLGKARSYAAMRQYAASEELLLKADAVAAEFLGAAHPMRLQVLSSRHRLLREAGRPSEAKDLEKFARKLARESGNQRHTVTWAELTRSSQD
jgi:tetratricopeptide (TPR) repeat protein